MELKETEFGHEHEAMLWSEVAFCHRSTMGQPVKLSDPLVSDARIVGRLMERSIAGQVEFWARLGQAMEPMLDGAQVLTLCQTARALPLSSCLETVDTAE